MPTGGVGADVLSGGGGDRFVYQSYADSNMATGVDAVAFVSGSDKLDFTALHTDGDAPRLQVGYMVIVLLLGSPDCLIQRETCLRTGATVQNRVRKCTKDGVRESLGEKAVGEKIVQGLRRQRRLVAGLIIEDGPKPAAPGFSDEHSRLGDSDQAWLSAVELDQCMQAITPNRVGDLEDYRHRRLLPHAIGIIHARGPSRRSIIGESRVPTPKTDQSRG